MIKNISYSILSIFLIICFNKNTLSQELLHFPNFHNQGYLYNTAYSSLSERIQANLLVKYLWTGIKDSPRLYSIYGYGALKNYKSIKVGGKLSNMKSGPSQRIEAMISYSQNFKLNTSLNIALSAGVGVLNYSIDFQKLRALVDNNDNLLPNQVGNQLYPQINVGFALYHKKFNIGISTLQPINNNISKIVDTSSSIGRIVPNFFGMASYLYEITPNYSLTSALLVKVMEVVPVQTALALRFNYKKNYWIASEYNYNTHLAFSIGADIADYKISYAYTYNLNGIQNYTTGSHDVILGIYFNKIDKNKFGNRLNY